jgi:hypothetical protein
MTASQALTFRQGDKQACRADAMQAFQCLGSYAPYRTCRASIDLLHETLYASVLTCRSESVTASELGDSRIPFTGSCLSMRNVTARRHMTFVFRDDEEGPLREAPLGKQ